MPLWRARLHGHHAQAQEIADLGREYRGIPPQRSYRCQCHPTQPVASGLDPEAPAAGGKMVQSCPNPPHPAEIKLAHGVGMKTLDVGSNKKHDLIMEQEDGR